MENEIKNEIKVKTKYWHECQLCNEIFKQFTTWALKKV